MALTDHEIVHIAERFLFGNHVITEKAHKNFAKHVIDSMERIDCCVLWNRDEKLLNLLQANNLPSIGMKEVIINRVSIRASEDYIYRGFVLLA